MQCVVLLLLLLVVVLVGLVEELQRLRHVAAINVNDVTVH